MGNPISKAKEVKDEEKGEIENILETLENKLETFLLEVEAIRGLQTENSKEVVGGRTVMRVSDIRVSTSSDVSKNITGAISDFFEAATNDLDGDEQRAKKSAVRGAEKLVTGAITALFGKGSGKGSTKKSFVVLFLNNAFVRVDYYVYTYSASGTKWGAVANESGACYLADLAVLDITQLQPQEIDFLLSQALRIGPSELEDLNRLKFALIQSSILGRQLSKDNVTFDELAKIANALAESTKIIDEAFGALEDFDFTNVTGNPVDDFVSVKSDDNATSVKSDDNATPVTIITNDDNATPVTLPARIAA